MTDFGTLMLPVPGTVDPGTASLTFAGSEPAATVAVAGADVVITPGPPDLITAAPTSVLSYVLPAALDSSGFVAGETADLSCSDYTCGGVPFPAVMEPFRVTAGMVSGGSTLKWSLTLGPLVVDVSSAGTALSADATEVLFQRWQITDVLTGLPVSLADPPVTSFEIAAVRGVPAEADWQPAQMITRADGEYACLKVGPGQGISLTAGTYSCWGRLTSTSEQLVRRAPGYLIVRAATPGTTVLLPAAPPPDPVNTRILLGDAVLTRPLQPVYFYFCDTDGGDIALSLFASAGALAQLIFVNTGANALILSAAAGERYNGASSLTIPAYERATLTDYLPGKWSIDMTYIKSTAAVSRLQIITTAQAATTQAAPLAIPASTIDQVVVHRTLASAETDWLFSANQAGRNVILAFSNDETSTANLTISAQPSETITGPLVAPAQMFVLQPGESLTLANTGTTTWTEVA